MKASSVLLLLAALACPALALPTHLDRARLHAPRVGQSTCDTCQDVVRDLERYLADPKTQDAIVAFVQQNVCELLPSDTAQTCAMEARVLIAQAAASMQQTLSPRMVCDYIGVCQGADALAATGAPPEVSDWMDCHLCQLGLGTLVQRLRDPDSRAAIQSSAEAGCKRLHGDIKATTCLADVAQLFASVDALLDDVDVHKVCEVVQFCDGGAPAPAAVARLQELRSQLSAVPVAASPETCDACKSIIAQAAAVLMDPEVQREMLAYAKTACTAFDSYQTTCEEYVDEFGQAAFALAVAYLQPEQVCSSLGYCEPAPAPS